MPDQPSTDPTAGRTGLPTTPPGTGRRDPGSLRREAPVPPGRDSGPLLRGDRTGQLSSADGGTGETADEKALRDAQEDYEESGHVRPGFHVVDGEVQAKPKPPAGQDEEDEETITTGEETTTTPPTAEEMARIVAAKIGGNRTPDTSDLSVVKPADGPLLADKLDDGVTDPLPEDGGIQVQQPGPTRLDKLGQPPSPNPLDG